ncbi:MAG: hypothetical protein ACXACU_03175 [Candidatus Hodarchaeales archaeon]|jgi:hypothetical protein
MLNEFIISLFNAILEILLSIPFGAVLISLGAMIYSPTGNRLGKYCLIIGFIIFSVNHLLIRN